MMEGKHMVAKKIAAVTLSAFLITTVAPSFVFADSVTSQTTNADGSTTYIEEETSGSTTTTTTVTVEDDGSATITVSTDNSSSGASTDITYTSSSEDSSSVTLEKVDTTSSSVTIPATVTAADGTVYEVTEIGASALKNSDVSSVSIPKTVETIAKNAFADCDNLKSINTKNTDTIEKGAFKNCDSLTSLKTSATTIGANAFKGCDLSKITYTATTKNVSFASNALKGAGKGTTIVIKAASKSLYKSIVKAMKNAGAKKATFKFKKIS